MTAVAAGAALVVTALAAPSAAWADGSPSPTSSSSPAAESSSGDGAGGSAPAADGGEQALVQGTALSGISAALREAGERVAAASEQSMEAGLEAGRLAGAAAAATGGQIEIEGPAAASSQGWVVPLVGQLTDGFGPRPERPAGAAPFHHGTDIAAGCGSTIHAAADGVVISAGPFGTYGNWILLSGAGGISTGYAHIRDGGVLVQVGDTVAAGEAIALVGSTGASTGCHLHFEVRVLGAAIDPVPFMRARDAALG